MYHSGDIKSRKGSQKKEVNSTLCTRNGEGDCFAVLKICEKGSKKEGKALQKTKISIDKQPMDMIQWYSILW